MPITDETLPQIQPILEKQSAGSVLLAGIGLSSFSALLLELSLTRLFSVVLFYHFAFLAISIALLGLGAGGVFSYLLKKRLERWTVEQIGTFVGTLNAVLMLIVLEVDLYVPVSLQLTKLN